MKRLKYVLEAVKFLSFKVVFYKINHSDIPFNQKKYLNLQHVRFMKTKDIQIVLLLLPLIAILFACQSKKKNNSEKEDTEAKKELQGIWVDDETESPLMLIKGDTIYYADSQAEPVYFKVIKDTLFTYGSNTASYRIEKRMKYTLCLHSVMGEQLNLHKSEDPEGDLQSFAHKSAPIPIYNSQVKKDSVVVYKDKRYHVYTYINPSRLKVYCSSVSEDGFQVDNVYYDNIMHICVYDGANMLYGSDIKKQMFQSLVPANFLDKAILSDMNFKKVSKDGFCYEATLQQPESYISNLIDLYVSFDGKMTMKVVSSN